jgi:hypothetical protein
VEPHVGKDVAQCLDGVHVLLGLCLGSTLLIPSMEDKVEGVCMVLYVIGRVISNMLLASYMPLGLAINPTKIIINACIVLLLQFS